MANNINPNDTPNALENTGKKIDAISELTKSTLESIAERSEFEATYKTREYSNSNVFDTNTSQHNTSQHNTSEHSSWHSTSESSQANTTSSSINTSLPGQEAGYSYNQTMKDVGTAYNQAINSIQQPIGANSLTQDTNSALKQMGSPIGDNKNVKISEIAKHATEEVPNVSDTYYNKAHLDKKGVANTTYELAKNTTAESDLAEGDRKRRAMTAVVKAPLGAASRASVKSDLRSSIVGASNEEVAKMKSLLGDDYQIGMESKGKIGDILNSRASSINKYLNERGINSANLNKRDIDKLLKSNKLDDNVKKVLEAKVKNDKDLARFNNTNRKGSITNALNAAGATIDTGTFGSGQRTAKTMIKTANYAAKASSYVVSLSGHLTKQGINKGQTFHQSLVKKHADKQIKKGEKLGEDVQKWKVKSEQAGLKHDALKEKGAKTKAARKERMNEKRRYKKMTATQKVKYNASKFNATLNKSKTVRNFKDKVASSRLGKGASYVKGKFSAANKWLTGKRNAIANSKMMKFINKYNPLKAFNALSMLKKKIMLYVGAGVLSVCISIFMIYTIVTIAVMPLAFLETEENIGQKLLMNCIDYN